MVSNILQAKEGFNLLMSLCFSQIKKREKCSRDTLQLPVEEVRVPKCVFSCTDINGVVPYVEF